MNIVFWLFYYVVPGVLCWKKRTAELPKCIYSLFCTMLALYTAIWSENIIRKILESLIPSAELKVWSSAVALVTVWFIVEVFFRCAVNKAAPEGLAVFEFPEKVCKFLVPLTVFLHCGLIMAMLFTIFSVSPAARYVNTFSLNKSMCSGARYRVLWSVFLVDRFSWQPVGVNARRSAFDRFVPENPDRVLREIAEAKRRKAEAEAAAVAAELAAKKAALEKAEAEAKRKKVEAEAEKKARALKRKQRRRGRIIIYHENNVGENKNVTAVSGTGISETGKSSEKNQTNAGSVSNTNNQSQRKKHYGNH